MPGLDEQETREIPQRILVLRDFCIRGVNAACDRCLSACPANAISLAENVAEIDRDACTLCGICQGICDAFTSTGVKVSDIDAAVMRIALSEPNRDVLITCSRNVPNNEEAASNVVSVPCLAMIPVELWTKFLARGIKVSVAVDLGACESCSANSKAANPHEEKPAGDAEDLYASAIAQAEAYSGRQVGFSETVPKASDESLLARLARAGESGDRRDAFSDIVASFRDASSGALRKRTDQRLRRVVEQNDRIRQRTKLNLGNGQEFNRFSPTGRIRTLMLPSRQMLLEAIEADPMIAPRIELEISQTNPNSCEGDLRCTRACPTGARRPNPQTGELAFESRLCIGCGSCISVCRHDAIALANVTADALTC